MKTTKKSDVQNDAKTTTKTRAALYRRISAKEQLKGFSLKSQETRMRAYCESQGWTVAGLYSDNGLSGRNDKRPAYEKLMRDIDSYDVVVSVRLDRVHRNIINFAKMMALLESKGKSYASVTEPFDTSTAMGKLFMRILMALAQAESEQLGERVSQGFQTKYSTTAAVCGPVTPGFVKGPVGELLPDPETAKFYVQGIRLFLRRVPLDVIASKWNGFGLRRAQGGAWNADKVRLYLENPRIAGYRVWDNFPVMKAGGLIDIQTYWKVQAELNRRSELGAAGRSEDIIRAKRNARLRAYLQTKKGEKTKKSRQKTKKGRQK